MKKVKIFIGTLALCISASIFLVANVEKADAKAMIVWDKKPIDCTWHFGTQCTGQGDGCDAVACEQYQYPEIK